MLTDDAVVVLVIGDVETDRGRSIRGGIGLAEHRVGVCRGTGGLHLAGVALDDVAAGRKMTKLWGVEAGRATRRIGSWSSAPPKRAAAGHWLEPARHRLELATEGAPRHLISGMARVQIAATRAKSLLYDEPSGNVPPPHCPMIRPTP